MTETPRETRVLDAVVSLVDSLLDDFDVVDLLTELTERCAELLDVESAGLLLADPLEQLRLLAATSEAGPRTGALPAAGRRGPVRGLLHHRSAGLGGRPRRRDRPVAAVRPRRARRRLRLRARRSDARRRHRPGRARLVRRRPGELNEADLLVAQTLAHIACVAILQEHAPTPATVMPQLRSALTSRVVVEQAKGFLREASTCPSSRPSRCCAPTRAPAANT